MAARDRTSPQDSTASVSPVLATRKDAPALHPTSHGENVSASRVAHSQASRHLALQDLHRDMNAHSASGLRASEFVAELSSFMVWE